MSGHWDQSKILKLIKLYQENECLWNTKSVFYKKGTARDNAYKRMIQGMGDPTLRRKIMQHKIRNLRNIYFQEFKKVKETGGAYKSKLFWYDEIDFLANYIEENDSVPTETAWLASPTRTRDVNLLTQDFLSVNVDCNNVYIKEECIDIDQVEKLEKPFDQEDEEEEDEEEDGEEEEFEEGEEEEEGSIIVSNHPPAKRQRFETDVFDMPQTSSINHATIHGDEFYYFGLSIAAQLKNMPLDHALQVQAKLQNLLTNERCQLLKDSTPSLNPNTLSEEKDLSFERKIGNSSEKKHISMVDLKSPNRQIVCGLHNITENQLRMQSQLSEIQSSIDRPRDAVADKIMKQTLLIAKETLATVKQLFGEGNSFFNEEMASYFPITNLSDLEQLEAKIQDKSSEDELKAFLIHKKGQQSLDSLLRNLVTDEFLCNYNWDGRWGKRSLKSSGFFGSILTDVFCQLNKKEFEGEIRKAIELSHNRSKQKRIKCLLIKPPIA